MTIRAWRIVKAKHSTTAFTGEAAKAFPGRWNSRGVPMVYVASSISLAILEVLVNLQSQELLDRYALFEVSFDNALVFTIKPLGLPDTWRDLSPDNARIRTIGDDWISAGRSAVLGVPSAVVPDEWNYLLNPNHSDYVKISVGPKRSFQLDPRLIKMPPT